MGRTRAMTIELYCILLVLSRSCCDMHQEQIVSLDDRMGIAAQSANALVDELNAGTPRGEALASLAGQALTNPLVENAVVTGASILVSYVDGTATVIYIASIEDAGDEAGSTSWRPDMLADLRARSKLSRLAKSVGSPRALILAPHQDHPGG